MMGILINITLLVTAAALGLLAVKTVLGNRITPRGHMLMWLVLAAVLATVPFTGILPETEFAARNYVPQVEDSSLEEVRGTVFIAGVLLEDEDRIYEVVNNRVGFKMPLTGITVEKEYFSTPDFFRLAVKTGKIIWAAGSAVCLLILVASYIRNRRKLLRISSEPDEETLAVFKGLKEEMKIRGGLKLKAGADSTLLAMAGGPTVFLEDGYEDDELRFVLAHELTHYKHGDLMWNVIAAILICLFWWNPVIWIAFRRFRRDMEVYCDFDAAEAVGDKKGYARVLVKAAAGKGRFIPATTSLIGGEKEVSARVKALAAFKKPKVITAAIGVVLLVVITACLLLNPKSNVSQPLLEHPDLAGDFGFAQLYEVKGNIYAQFAEGRTSYSDNAEMCSGLRRYMADLSGESFSLTDDEERAAILGDEALENYQVRFQLMCDYGGWFELDTGEKAYIGHSKDDSGEIWLVYPQRQAVYKCRDASVATGIAKHTRELFAAEKQPSANTDGLGDKDYLAVRCKEPYVICAADRTYEEALEQFKADYADFSSRYGADKAEEIYSRYRGTCLEHKDSRIMKLRIDKVSGDEKAVLFYFEYQRTFLNDIGSVQELWAGGGMDAKSNNDGTITYTEGQLGYIINDGNCWTYYAWSAVPQDIDIDEYFT